MSSGTLQRQWESVRKTYEASDEWANYKQSGQGNPNFPPHFCKKNAVHVLLHYIIRDATDEGESSLELCVFSCMDSSVHVNSIDNGGVDTTDLESITSAGAAHSATPHSVPPKKSPRDPIVKHLKKLANILKAGVVGSVNRKKRKMTDTDEEELRLRKKVRDLMEQKARIKALQQQLGSDDSGQEYLDKDLQQVKARIDQVKAVLKPRRDTDAPALTAPVVTPAPISADGKGMSAAVPLWMGRLSEDEQNSSNGHGVRAKIS